MAGIMAHERRMMDRIAAAGRVTATGPDEDGTVDLREWTEDAARGRGLVNTVAAGIEAGRP